MTSVDHDPSTSATVETNIYETSTFDVRTADIPSFGALQHARGVVFARRERVEGLDSTINELSHDGEEGRRRGFGLWMLSRFEEAADQLSGFDDDVANYTRAKALMSLGRPQDAEPVFQALADKYPDEPRPRGGLLEARFEAGVKAAADGDLDPACDQLDADLAATPESFQGSAECHYMRGRLCETRRDWDGALEGYLAARELDPGMRTALMRAAYLAERGGLDELAIELYEQLMHIKPTERATLLNLGVLYEDAGRDQDAAACYETVVKCFPTDQRARLYLEDARRAMEMYYDEDQERKEDRLNQILRIPITDFELSVRARNCLNKMNITTLGDLVCRTEQELLSYKNFGETSLSEIKEILHSKGLRLGMPREEAVLSVEHHARRQATGTDSGDVVNKPITELQLSIRARRTVESLGCLTLGDIQKHSADELLGMPNFGVTSLQELRNKLGEHNLKLRGE